MTLAKNTYAFESKRPAPSMSGKGPRSRTLLLAQAQGGQTRSEFVELVSDFLGVSTGKAAIASVTSTPTQPKAAKAQTDTLTRVVVATIAAHAKATSKTIGHYRAAKAAALTGPKALRAYRKTLDLPNGPKRGECCKLLLHAIGS